jgi:hypothetical protein
MHWVDRPLTKVNRWAGRGFFPTCATRQSSLGSAATESCKSQLNQSLNEKTDDGEITAVLCAAVHKAKADDARPRLRET